MSSNFPPRLVVTKNSMGRTKHVDCWRVITYLKSYVQRCYSLDDSYTEYCSVEELTALQAENERLRKARE